MPVYFIQSGEGPVKIGYVRPDRSIHTRLGELQVGNPQHLYLLALVNGGPALERKLHRAFASEHVRGEWFKWSPLMAKVIEAYQKNPDADLFNMNGSPKAGGRPISHRVLKRRAAKAAFNRALADGSMTIRYVDGH